jgi:hypothetical protein
MSRKFRALLVAVVATAGLLVTAMPAQAQDDLNEVVAALKSSHVYVSPTAGASPNTASQLKAQLRSGDHVFVAMLPADANANPQDLADKLSQQVGDPQAVVAVTVGRKIAAAAPSLPSGTAADLAVRADSVSNASDVALGTFIVNIHNWQAAHPEEITSTVSTEDSNVVTSVVLPGGGVLVLLALGFVILRQRLRRKHGDIKLRSPEKVRDAIRGILQLQSQVDDSATRQTINLLVRDTEEVFARLRKHGSKAELADTASTFDNHLTSLYEVLAQYVDVQNNRRYYEQPDRALASGREAVNGFAQYALVSAQRAGQSELTRFRVNTKILSAQRYS